MYTELTFKTLLNKKLNYLIKIIYIKFKYFNEMF